MDNILNRIECSRIFHTGEGGGAGLECTQNVLSMFKGQAVENACRKNRMLVILMVHVLLCGSWREVMISHMYVTGRGDVLTHVNSYLSNNVQYFLWDP